MAGCGLSALSANFATNIMVQHVVYRDEWEGHNGDEVADRQWRAGLRHHEQSPDRRTPRTRLAASLQEFKSMFKRLAALEESSCAQAETVREQAETIRLQAEALESTRADMRELRREIDQLRRAQASAASQAVAPLSCATPTLTARSGPRSSVMRFACTGSTRGGPTRTPSSTSTMTAA